MNIPTNGLIILYKVCLPEQNEEKNETWNVGGAHISLHLESQENADTQHTGDGVVQL